LWKHHQHYRFNSLVQDKAVTRNPGVTGGKGPNNQWAHAEYIENPVNKWSQCVQWAKIRYIQNVPSYVNIMCPVGKCWSHLKCTQPCDSNVPRGYMVITFTMSPSIWSQCAQWGHGDHIHNVPSDGITMCSVGTCWVLSKCIQWWDHNVPSGHMLSSFTMCPSMWSQCPQWLT
jgi:hypothetical protein